MVIQVVDYLHRSLVLVNDLLGPVISKAKGWEHTVEVGDPEKKDLLDGDSIVQPPIRSVFEDETLRTNGTYGTLDGG